MSNNPHQTPFQTENLELSSFLLLRGHKLIGATPISAKIVSFEFEPAAVSDIANFYNGSILVPPNKLFEAHRTLRSLIITAKRTRGVA